MEKLFKKKGKDWYFSMLLAASIFFTPLRSTLIAIGNQLHLGLGRIFSIASVFLFLLILFLPILGRFKITKDMVFWYIFVTISWITSWIFHTKYTSQWIGEIIDIFVHALPYYIIVQNIDDWKTAKYILFSSSRITILMMILYTLLELFQKVLFSEAQYNQFSGVILAGAATMCVLAFLEDKKVKDLIWALLAFGMIILFGARMPIACIILGIFLFLLEQIIQKREKILLTSKRGASIFLAILLLCVISVISILLLATNEMTNLGKGQRILWQIANGEFFKSSGRAEIYRVVLDSIIDNPLCGYGMIADRIQISIRNFGNADLFTGSYAHNIFLELLMQYGIVLGGLLSVFIIIVSIKLLTKPVLREKKLVAIWAIAMTFGILLFSGPVYSNKHFWIMLGLHMIYKINSTKMESGEEKK